VCGEANPTTVIAYNWIVFKGTQRNGNGGCILCESTVRIEISHCHFLDVRYEGEGGALYARNAILYLEQSCFNLCRTATKGNSVGGNA